MALKRSPGSGELLTHEQLYAMVDEHYYASDVPRSNGASLHPRVLLFSLVYPPDNYSGGARPHRFSKYLQELGYLVDVLAGGTAEQYIHDGNVHRVRAQLDHGIKNSLVERVFRRTLLPHDEGIAWIPRIVSFARRWRTDECVIISTSPPFTTHLAALAAKKLYGWAWIADFRDPLLGNPYRNNSVRTVDRMVERAIFRNADALIANTDTVAELWRGKYPEHATKIHVIWNGFDPQETMCPAPIPQQARRVLRHVGNIYGDRYPEMLLASLNRLIASGKCDPAAFCLDLVGPLETPGEGASSDPWFRCDPNLVSKSEANRLITEADYLLLLDVTKGNTGLQVPAKTFDYIRIGRPILACTVRGSPVDRILTHSGVPYVGLYAGDSDEEIDRRVLTFLNFSNNPVEPSNWFQRTFNGERQAETLGKIVETVHRRSIR